MIDDVFVIIPAYNEATVLRSTIQSLIDVNMKIVVVDDNSKDETWSILQNLPVYALRHVINLGQGAALQTGMTFALVKGAQIIVHFDADGQHRAKDIETMIEPILRGEADVVLGSRFLRKEDAFEIPFSRRVTLRVAVLVNGIFTGLWLTDAHNGFRALSREAAGQIHLYENRFAHASEILNQIHHLGLRYVERPTTIEYSEYSRAKGQSLWNAFNILIDILLRKVFK